jgi:two-component system NtrC family sensor kinase
MDITGEKRKHDEEVLLNMGQNSNTDDCSEKSGLDSSRAPMMTKETDEGMLVIQDGILKSIGQPLTETLGFLDTELMGASFKKILTPELIELIKIRLKEQIGGKDVPQTYPLIFQRKDGKAIPLEITASLIKYEGRPAVKINTNLNGVLQKDQIHPVAYDARRDKEAQERNSFLAEIVDHTSESILATDQDGRIIYVNPATEKMFGYTEEELMGRDLETLTTELYKERIQNEIFKSAVCGRVWTGELLNRRRDGKLFYASTSVSKMVDKDGNFIALVWFQRDITQTRRYQEEMIKIEKEKAETLRILHENEAAINRSLNKAKRELQEKNLELEKRTFELEAEKKRLKEAYEKLNQMQAQLLQSEKLASLGQLSAGVAHEINNPISFIHSNLGTLSAYVGDIKTLLSKYSELEAELQQNKGCVELLKMIHAFKEEVGLNSVLDDFDKIISESQEGTQRVRHIIQNLKDFSHVDKGELELADINQGIESTLNIVWNELKYKAEVIKEYGAVPQIECFPQQLNQVFMNILVNAAQAIETKGEIRIKTYQMGESLVVEISDTGVGIPKENLMHIFEPFYTTKEVGKGTGLGLSVVYGIIQRHRGQIEVESEVNKGSTFRVILPIANSAEHENEEEIPQESRANEFQKTSNIES